MNRVTVIDVAKKAGVSQTTVSRVLNNHPQIKESTRKKVWQAIEELGFSPNQLARSMVMKKTRTIGLSVGDISNPFYAEAAKVIIGKARQLEYDVIITDTDYNYDNFEKNLKTMVDKRVDGILIATIHFKDSMVNELFKSGMPIVYVNRKPELDGIHYVTADNQKAACLAMEHLVQLGHKRIAFLSYPARFPTFHERYLGYLAAIKTLGLGFDDSIVYHGEFSHENVFQFVSNTLSFENRPTAFLTTSDNQAMSVIDAVSRLGFKVPEEISVVGIGDINIASHPYIGLTTVSIQKRNMFGSALDMLISLIDQKQKAPLAEQVVLEPELMIRKTTNVVNMGLEKEAGML